MLLKLIRKIRKGLEIYRVFSKLSDTQRTSVLRMLYWKTHYQEIPSDEYHKLIGGGWLVPHDFGSGYTWSDDANRISNLIENEKTT